MDKQLIEIQEKVIKTSRISTQEAYYLFKNASLSHLGLLAKEIKSRKSSDKVYFVKNYHIEPTNICIYNCKFCSFSETEKEKGWSKSEKEILDEVKKLSEEINELHIVGGSNEEFNLDFYTKLLEQIKILKPKLHIKAFTASEIHYMSELAGITIKETLERLKNSGLDSMPGGGAEIFNSTIRTQLCPTKIDGEQWLNIHATAHSLNISSNATMLYGHIESINDRIEHMDKLRNLQDKTDGFKAFIPLKFKNQNNNLSEINETNIIEDLKMFALSRIFLDNFDHIKVYWPAFGKSFAQLSLEFGVDDIDGTISNSTKIYSMAGANEQSPEMSDAEAVKLIKELNLKAIERDAKYNIINEF